MSNIFCALVAFLTKYRNPGRGTALCLSAYRLSMFQRDFVRGCGKAPVQWRNRSTTAH